MRTIAWLTLGAVALAAHELVVALWGRGGLRGRRVWALRYGLLGAILAATAFSGPAVVERVGRLIPSSADPIGPFTPAGDTFLTNALGSQQPRRPFPVGQSPADATAWSQEVLAALRDQAGLTTEESAAVPLTVVRAEMVGDVKRSLVTFPSWDGTLIPAYLHEPPGESPKAAVLVVAGHGAGIAATAGLVEDYQHSAALTLAQRGYVTLTPELRGFGLLGSRGAPNHRWVAAAALESGSSYKAVVVRDLARALTVLQHQPRVDQARLAVAGTSLGGELAVLLAALDPRVRVVLSHSYGGAVGPTSFATDRTDEATQTPHGCHAIPGINRILHQEDWARLAAPRPLLVVRGAADMPSEIDRFAEAVRHSYRAYGAPARFELAIERGGHEFYIEPAVRFLSRWL